jgi:hypothetical protein
MIAVDVKIEEETYDICNHGRIRTILNYKKYLRLDKRQKSTSMTHERIQVSVNSTGVMFIYL